MASDPEHNAPPTDSESRHHQSDLFSSASALAGSFSKDGSAFDKAKAAEAAEDLVDAAAKYGKLQEKGYGSYVEKAEAYLHTLHSSSENKPTEHPPAAKTAVEGGEHAAPEEPKASHEEKKPPEEHHSGGGGGLGGFGGGGFGDYMKMAEGFLKK